MFVCSQQEDAVVAKSDLSVKMKNLKGIVTLLSKKINNNRRVIKNFKAKFVENSNKLVDSIKEINLE